MSAKELKWISFYLFVYACVCRGHQGREFEVWAGEDATLQCGGKLSPRVDMFWKKLQRDGKWKTVTKRFALTNNSVPTFSPVAGSDVRIKDDGSLYIASVIFPQTNGTYRYMSSGSECRASLLVYQKMKTLVVRGTPKTVPENSTMSVICEVHGGNPTPNIMWDIPRTVVISKQKNYAYRSEVTLTVMKEYNNVEIKCRGSIQKQMLVKPWKFKVLYKPKVNIKTKGDRDTQGESSVLTLECSADGNPEPQIKWMVERKVLTEDTATSDKEITRLDGNAITVSLESIGRSYACQATNSQGSDTQEFPIHPIPRNPPSPMVIYIGLGIVAGALLFAGMCLCYLCCKSKISKLLCPAGQQDEIATEKTVQWQADDTDGQNTSAEVLTSGALLSRQVRFQSPEEANMRRWIIQHRQRYISGQLNYPVMESGQP